MIYRNIFRTEISEQMSQPIRPTGRRRGWGGQKSPPPPGYPTIQYNFDEFCSLNPPINEERRGISGLPPIERRPTQTRSAPTSPSRLRMLSRSSSVPPSFAPPSVPCEPGERKLGRRKWRSYELESHPTRLPRSTLPGGVRYPGLSQTSYVINSADSLTPPSSGQRSSPTLSQSIKELHICTPPQTPSYSPLSPSGPIYPPLADPNRSRTPPSSPGWETLPPSPSRSIEESPEDISVDSQSCDEDIEALKTYGLFIDKNQNLGAGAFGTVYRGVYGKNVTQNYHFV